jgi:hypothetical protein
MGVQLHIPSEADATGSRSALPELLHVVAKAEHVGLM